MTAIEPTHLTHATIVGTDRITDTERSARNLEMARAGFLARYRTESTRKGYATALRQWFDFCQTRFVDPLKVERGHIEVWARTLEDADGFSLSTVANKLNALSGFYRLATADGYCDRDPMLNVVRPKIPRESPREGLTRTELHDLVTASEPDPRDYALVTILGYNGLRVSEALGIDIERVEKHKGQTLVNVRRKGGKWQPIPFAVETAWAIERLSGARTEGPLFLSREGNRLDSHGAGRIVKRLARQAGITKHITPHSLRHTFVTLSRDMGVSDGDIQAATGHADGRMISYYDRHAAAIQRNPTHALAAYVRRAT